MDTSTWGDFKISDIATVAKGTRLRRQDMIEGTTRFVGASAMNNGVTGTVGNSEHLHEPHCVTVCYNGSIGESFYQDEKFWASDDVNVVRTNDDITADAYLFLAVVLRTYGRRYKYTDKWTATKMGQEIIKLPQKPEGTPDWSAMADMMAATRERGVARVDVLKTAVRERVPVDVSGWGTFVLGEIADVTKGSRLRRQDMIEGTYRHIGASAMNNGVTRTVGNDEHLNDPHCLTVAYDGSIGESFYQDEKFWATDAVNIVRVKDDIDQHAYLFLATVLRVVGKGYKYTDKWTAKKMTVEEIRLPQTADGKPDWEYMSEHMRKHAEVGKARVEKLAAQVRD